MVLVNAWLQLQSTGVVYTELPQNLKLKRIKLIFVYVKGDKSSKVQDNLVLRLSTITFFHSTQTVYTHQLYSLLLYTTDMMTINSNIPNNSGEKNTKCFMNTGIYIAICLCYICMLRCILLLFFIHCNIHLFQYLS